MTNNLRPGERLDDLQLGGLELIQNPSKFCFGVDAVFLSDFAKVKPGETVLDMNREWNHPGSTCRKDERKAFYRLLRYRLRLQKWQDEVLHITIWKTELAL